MDVSEHLFFKSVLKVTCKNEILMHIMPTFEHGEPFLRGSWHLSTWVRRQNTDRTGVVAVAVLLVS